MGKTVHHETIVTYTCDHCGRQDIIAESTAQESRRIPDGWCCFIVFDGAQPTVTLGGDSYDRHWRLDGVSGKWEPALCLWCHECRKIMGVKTKDQKPDPPGPVDRWLGMLLGRPRAQ